ncbi:MAG: hydrogenase 3 maturation endopeptidase HyCI [Candidatus Omnitrophica bacterium]|nr:hydrogenase 3 maturation endopeptidase HyCI [Candidatus Omnitrophota bacterium]
MKDIFKGKVVVVGVGNILRRDDGFGPVLIDKLKANTSVVCIDAGSSLEGYAGKIAKEKPDTILIADAVHLGLEPGNYDILKSSEIVKGGLTTHDISPRMFLDYLKKETGADIYMLGIQPEDVSFGEGLSESVKGALEEIVGLIREAEHA